jgi:hypothetical protein
VALAREVRTHAFRCTPPPRSWRHGAWSALLDELERLCDACLAGKQKRNPFPLQAINRADKRLGLVHADLCGPIDPPTPGGKRYFLFLVDDNSRYMWLHLLATKDQASAAIKKFQAAAELESG